MPQSLSQVYLHSVWSTQNRTPMIHSEVEQPLYAYMGGIIKNIGGIPIQINGMPDHIHVLSTLPRTVSISKYIEVIKSSSSTWIKTLDRSMTDFTWQRGYATFSVSKSIVPIVNQYILNQKAHHKKQTFQEEVIEFLKEYEVEYDETYLWD